MDVGTQLAVSTTHEKEKRANEELSSGKAAWGWACGKSYTVKKRMSVEKREKEKRKREINHISKYIC